MGAAGLDLSRLSLSIDLDGQWRHQGEEITHPRILAMLYLGLQKIGDGYFVCVEGLCAPVDVADCPFVVLAVRSLDDGKFYHFTGLGTRFLTLNATAASPSLT